MGRSDGNRPGGRARRCYVRRCPMASSRMTDWNVAFIARRRLSMVANLRSRSTLTARRTVAERTIAQLQDTNWPRRFESSVRDSLREINRLMQVPSPRNDKTEGASKCIEIGPITIVEIQFVQPWYTATRLWNITASRYAGAGNLTASLQV